MIDGKLSLFEDAPDRVNRNGNGGDGAARLLRELARRGLPADAWPTAALLVLMLDHEAPSS